MKAKIIGNGRNATAHRRRRRSYGMSRGWLPYHGDRVVVHIHDDALKCSTGRLSRDPFAWESDDIWAALLDSTKMPRKLSRKKEPVTFSMLESCVVAKTRLLDRRTTPDRLFAAPLFFAKVEEPADMLVVYRRRRKNAKAASVAILQHRFPRLVPNGGNVVVNWLD